MGATIPAPAATISTPAAIVPIPATTTAITVSIAVASTSTVEKTRKCKAIQTKSDNKAGKRKCLLYSKR